MSQNVIGFYYPGNYEEVDKLCKYPEFGNFWVHHLDIPIGHRIDRFTNAEAAFQGLKYYLEAPQGNGRIYNAMKNASGEDAVTLKNIFGYDFNNNVPANKKMKIKQNNFSLKESSTLSRYGLLNYIPNVYPTIYNHSTFKGDINIYSINDKQLNKTKLPGNLATMYLVVKQKFSIEPLKSRLLSSGDAFLLEHNNRSGKDIIWSDNHDGTGHNLLGLMLMLIREQYKTKPDYKVISFYVQILEKFDNNKVDARDRQKNLNNLSYFTSDINYNQWIQMIRQANIEIVNKLKFGTYDQDYQELDTDYKDITIDEAMKIIPTILKHLDKASSHNRMPKIKRLKINKDNNIMIYFIHDISEEKQAFTLGIMRAHIFEITAKYIYAKCEISPPVLPELSHHSDDDDDFGEVITIEQARTYIPIIMDKILNSRLTPNIVKILLMKTDDGEDSSIDIKFDFMSPNKKHYYLSEWKFNEYINMIDPPFLCIDIYKYNTKYNPKKRQSEVPRIKNNNCISYKNI